MILEVELRPLDDARLREHELDSNVVSKFGTGSAMIIRPAAVQEGAAVSF